MRKFFALVLIFVALLSTAAPALACGTNPPPTVSTCHDIGSEYEFGIRIAGAQNGTYKFTSHFGTLVGGAPTDRLNFVQITNSDLRTFDWNASMPIDAVIVYAGGHSTVTEMDEQSSGAGFHGNFGWNGRPYRADKVTFCYDYELAVTVESTGTASGGSTTWDISKTVDHNALSAFAGDKATFNYTVGVTAQGVGGGDSNVLETVIKVTNPSPLFAKIVGGSATLNPGNISLLNSTVTCDGAPVQFPLYLPQRSEMTCTLTTVLDSLVQGTVTANVTTHGHVGGGSGSADTVWNTDPGTGGSGPSTATVTDTNEAFGGPRQATGTQSWTYPVELSCPSEAAAYANGPVVVTLDNTATITETNQSASQSASLTCYAPVVTTSANAKYDVQYTWTIDKNSTTENVELAVEETVEVPYTVTLNATGAALPGGEVSGLVSITNPNPDQEMTVAVADEIAAGVPVAFTDCGALVTVPAGATATCNFTTTVEALPAVNNTATATLNGIAFSATAPFTVGVRDYIDESVAIDDDRYGFVGDVTADMVASGPYVFEYNQTVGPYPEDDACRETSFINTASFTTNDTDTYADDSYILDVKVKCPVVTNCVRTSSWWLLHSDPSDPANYKPAWDLVGLQGPNTPFFDYGFTWVETLGKSGSNAYLLLAKDYIAAKLNVLSGALPSTNISDAIAQAESLLDAYDTDQGGITGDVATQFRNARTLLNSFNRGAAGVPMCTDCSGN